MSSFAAKPTQRSALLRRVASARRSRGIARRCVWWCAAWILLSALQPFIAVHFRGTGWEDEPGVHVRSSGESARFEYDDDDDAQDAGVHPAVMETTVFVPLGVDDPGAESLSQWLDHVLIAVMVMPGLLLLMWWVAPLLTVRGSPPRHHGADPPAAATPWRNAPPPTAPPFLF